MKKNKKVSTRKPAKAEVFSISLKVGDKTYESKGETALEALASLPKPAKITTKGFLTVTYGKLKKEVMYMPLRLRRLFYTKGFQTVQVKNLVTGLK